MFLRRETLRGLEPTRVTVCVQKQLAMRCQLLMVGVVVSLDGGVLDGAVHAFDLAVGRRMVRLRQPVLDATLAADSVEQLHAGSRLEARSVAWRRAKLDTPTEL